VRGFVKGEVQRGNAIQTLARAAYFFQKTGAEQKGSEEKKDDRKKECEKKGMM